MEHRILDTRQISFAPRLDCRKRADFGIVQDELEYGPICCICDNIPSSCRSDPQWLIVRIKVEKVLKESNCFVATVMPTCLPKNRLEVPGCKCLQILRHWVGKHIGNCISYISSTIRRSFDVEDVSHFIAAGRGPPFATSEAEPGSLKKGWNI